jgi:hypothetical protein
MFRSSMRSSSGSSLFISLSMLLILKTIQIFKKYHQSIVVMWQKSLPGAFSTLRPRRPIVFLSQQVPAFISRGATHHTDARDLYQRRRELHPNFVSGSEFTRIPLGFFTCRKAGTWDILFYFGCPKNPTASAGFEPANSGSSGQYANH